MIVRAHLLSRIMARLDALEGRLNISLDGVVGSCEPSSPVADAVADSSFGSSSTMTGKNDLSPPKSSYGTFASISTGGISGATGTAIATLFLGVGVS
jgi:hypothetical protein